MMWIDVRRGLAAGSFRKGGNLAYFGVVNYEITICPDR